MSLTSEFEQKLVRFAEALIDQQSARVIVEPQERASGFWFGGGNMIESPGGELIFVGRYRNRGDSRTGVAAGTRGLELAIFQSTNRGQSFEKVALWSKADLDLGERTVLSIEGSALRWTESGVELFVSTEKDHVGYPDEFAPFLKPGTGVWTIDRLSAPSVAELQNASPEAFLECRDPAFIHVKDPFVYDETVLFCSHPFCWSSSNTGFVNPGEEPVFDFFPRGPAWDVAMTRGTCVIDVPLVGAFSQRDVSLMFYDGGESVRDLDAHAHSVSRPRGYSCEELGGLAYLIDGDLSQLERLSKYAPLFVSPHGTGCSRYVDVLETKEGFFATWQQSQPDSSQPLVMNFLPRDQAVSLLS